MVISRTPLRVSFVGGGTDLPAYSRENGGAVVSTAIDKYIYAIVSERFEDSIRVSYSQTEIVDRVDDLRHELVREALKIAGLRRKVEVITVADVPSQGTGLGSSSAVTVGVLNALFAYQGILKSPEELASMASHIEIDMLGKPIGRQDQYACAYGGMQLLTFGPGDAVRRDPVVMPAFAVRELERNLLMFYTGQQRAAADVLTGVSSAVATKSDVHDAMARMRELALELFGSLTRGGDVSALGAALDENWRLKRRLHEGIANDAVDERYDAALDAGALGGKILGAGGGGFLLFYVEPERHAAVRSRMAGLRELPFRLDTVGSTIIHVGR